MQKTRKYVLNAIKEELCKVAPGAKIILFGSRARGDNQPDSDWDLLILIDKVRIEASDFDDISYPLYELGWRLNEKISPKLYTTADWLKRNFTLFYKNVEKEGIVL